MSVPTLEDEKRIEDYIERELGDHKLFREDPAANAELSDDATMSETSSQADFDALEQDAAWKFIVHDVKHPPSSPPDVVATTLRDIFRQPRPHRNPPSSSDESSEDDFEASDHSSDDDYAPSEGSSEMYESDGFEEPTEQQRRLERQQISRLKMQLVLSQGSEECAKQSIRDHMNAAMMRDMLVEEQRELIEQQQKTAEQKDAEVSSIKQELEQVKQQFKQQTAMVQALTSRQQATQQDVTRTANAIVSTQPTAQIEDLLTQFGSMSLGQGSQVSANVVFSAKSELDRRSSRVPEASSSLKNKDEDFTRSDKDTLKVPKLECDTYQARTKQTARATSSQAAPRRSSEIARMEGLVDVAHECINQALNRHAEAADHFEQAKAAAAFASDDLTDFQYLTLVESAGLSWCHLQSCVLKVKAELEEWLEYKVALTVLAEEVCPAAARLELTQTMEDILRLLDLPPRPNGHWRQEDGLWRFVTQQEMADRWTDEDRRRTLEEDLCSECSTDCDSE